MQLVTCLIVDDDDEFVNALTTQLEKLQIMKVAGRCRSIGEVILTLRSTSVDLIFLDVTLNSPDGLNGLDLLRQHPNLPPVVILSNHPGYAVESYTIGKARDFIVKPIDTQRLVLAINRALETDVMNQQLIDDKSVFLKMGRILKRFFIDDIDFFKGYGIYTKVITMDGATHVVNDSLAELESMLKGKKFMRVHKSYIINLNKLVGFDHNTLYLKNGSVPIGTSFKGKLDGLLRLFDNEFETPAS